MFARSNLHELKSIWNAVIRQYQNVAWIQHYFTASAEEQTTLQALHVVGHKIKGLQQLLTDCIQSKTQQLLVCKLTQGLCCLTMHPDQAQFGTPP